MRRTEYFDLFTSTLLRAPSSALAALTELFDSRAELRELEKPGVASVGGEGSDGQRLNFIDWLNALRGEGIREVQWELVQEPGNSHLKVITAGGIKRYT